MGIGDWGLGIGDWAQSPIPNPQSPIPIFLKLKKKAFFDGFEFDKLNDFKLSPPHKPIKQNFTKFLNENRPYENMVQEDNTPISKKKGKDNSIPPDYNPNWADEF